MNQPIHTGSIKINAVCTTRFRDIYLPELTTVKTNLISLHNTISDDRKHIFIHAAAFLNILFSLKKIFGSEIFKKDFYALQDEVTSKSNLISLIRMLDEKIDTVFTKESLKFKAATTDTRPRSENIWIVIDGAQHTLSSADKIEESDEKDALTITLLRFISDSRIGIIRDIENIEKEIQVLLPSHT